MTGEIRKRYLASTLRQNIGYFDKLGAGEITTSITANTDLIQDGISEKVGLSLSALSTFFVAYIIGYVKYWKLTLILTSSIVLIFLTTAGLGYYTVKWKNKSLESYAKGGTVAEQVISSARNVVASGAEDKVAREYSKHLDIAKRFGLKMKAVGGCMVGLVMCYTYLTYALAFWLGSRFLIREECTLSDVVTILLAMLVGAYSLGNVAPGIQAFTSSVAAASRIFGTINRASPIDPSAKHGKRLDKIVGDIELRNVKHIYPSRSDVVVLDNVDLVAPAGKTTALVGVSGSGKSTIIGLILRFYDQVGGEVLLDGVSVQEFNLRWLRQQISLVSQEPILFDTTISKNIQYGLGREFETLPNDTIQELVEHAAKMANAHDFITQLPNGYSTLVGEGGSLLSVGQKQRIAIARAIIRKPKILLLDEATSALDTRSEGIVQAALDKASQGRTTIVIAHRLSTIRHADNIVVFDGGRIVEQGSHTDLLQRKSAYYKLVEAQRVTAKNEKACESLEEVQGDLPNLERTFRAPSTSSSIGKGIDMDLSTSERSHLSQALPNGDYHKPVNSGLWTLIKFVGSFNRKEWHLMLGGLLSCIVCGAGNPIQAIFFAKSIAALSLPPGQHYRSQANFWSWMFFMLAIIQLISYLAKGVLFAYCSENLVYRARDTVFRTILRQEIGFFDKKENSTGALVSFLSTEITFLDGVSGTTLGTILKVITTLIVGCAIALAIGWKLALVCMSTIPIMAGCGYLRFWMLAKFHARAKKAYMKSASYACEATSSITTIASLAREDDVCKEYRNQIADQEAASLRSVLWLSTLYAASQGLTFLCLALGFWYGGVLIQRSEYSLFQFFLCFTAVIFGAQSAGTFSSFAPDIGRAKQAATELKALLDRKPEIDTWSNEGEVLQSMHGDIEFRNVQFCYSERQQPILRGLNLRIQPGQYVALVGASGCGKSTMLALLERFYNPSGGNIYIDGKDLSSLEIKSYRSHLALVTQEPILYQGTIRDNILLGVDEEVPEESVIQACKDAHIYDFIVSLPEGFSTDVGSRGSMLSGGQKQRIVIARALLRDPKVLLLDEATSALDSESEGIVLAALDKAAQGRTTIAVAHRLSTIQKADLIYVIDQGKVIERGTHAELLSNKGRYAELFNQQPNTIS